MSNHGGHEGGSVPLAKRRGDYVPTDSTKSLKMKSLSRALGVRMLSSTDRIASGVQGSTTRRNVERVYNLSKQRAKRIRQEKENTGGKIGRPRKRQSRGECNFLKLVVSSTE